MSASPAIPGPTYRNPLSFVSEARPDPLAYTMRMMRTYGDVLRLRIWGLPPIFMLSRPEHIRHVLQENSRNYTKGEIVAKIKVVLGEGLFTSEGDRWRRQRRLAQPAFHRQRVQGFADLMVEATDIALCRWQEHVRAGDAIDVMEEMSRLTLTVVGRALFGVDLGDQAGTVGPALLIALEELTRRVLNPFSLPMALPTPAHLRLRRATRELDRVVFDIIERRGAIRGVGADLLSMLMEARDADTGEGMSSRQLRDEVMTFVLAGHETTAVTLAWALHLLARNPDVTERLRAEVHATFGDGRLGVADLGQLGLTRRVIEETLRLYPPVPALQRQAIAMDEIDGMTIPPRAFVFLCPYATHRNGELWPDPERFDPDRFLPERAEDRPRFAYLPFGAGPRICIGNEFALMEAQIVLAMLMRRFRFEPVAGRPVESEVRLTLRPKSGVWMRFTDAESRSAA